MKPDSRIRATSGRLLASLALFAAALALPAPALAQVELATSPMASSTTTPVKPNLMFVLDDSGSMDWDYLPSEAQDFSGRYGFNTSQCNGNYYNPTITYEPAGRCQRHPPQRNRHQLYRGVPGRVQHRRGNRQPEQQLQGRQRQRRERHQPDGRPRFLLHLHAAARPPPRRRTTSTPAAPSTRSATATSAPLRAAACSPRGASPPRRARPSRSRAPPAAPP